MVAVPKFIVLQIKPANGTTLQPLRKNTITQKLQLTNNAHGQVCVELYNYMVCFFYVLQLYFLFANKKTQTQTQKLETFDDSNPS